MQKILWGIAIIIFLGAGVFALHSLTDAQNATVNTTVQITVCGNGEQEAGEQCDGSDLGGATCSNQGFSGGSISCNSGCEVDTSSCTSGGTGGGGFSARRDMQKETIPRTVATFSGKTEAGSTVVLLKDARVVTTAIADASGNFHVETAGLSAGTYVFSLYARNQAGSKSSTVPFSIAIVSRTTTNVRDIFLEIKVAVEEEIQKAKNTDLNGDNRVDLIDFSTLLYWFDASSVPAYVDLDGNGKADLVDFSIMAFYWTG